MTVKVPTDCGSVCRTLAELECLHIGCSTTIGIIMMMSVQYFTVNYVIVVTCPICLTTHIG